MTSILRDKSWISLLLALCLVFTLAPATGFANANLALGKTTTTSSVWQAGYDGSKAVDGNSTVTSWISGSAEATSWIYVDLGSLQTIDKVVVKWPEYTYATAFKIQTSTNASSWTDKYTTTSGSGGTTTATFSAASARYVRVHMTAKADVNYEIFELEVYNTGSGGGCTSNCHLENTAFLNSAWFSTAPSDATIAAYVNELAAKKIKYQFADVGLLRNTSTANNGTLPSGGYAGLAKWIKISRETDSNQKIIVNLNYGNRFTRVGGVKVANPNFGTETFNNNVNAVINQLVNVGLQIGGKGPYYKADGVHLDWEGFMQNDTTLLNSLQYLRDNALAGNDYFSISTPADPSYDGISTYQWSNAYIAQVAAIVNMMNPMLYDAMGWGSDVVNAATYKQYWVDEIKRYSNAIGNIGPGGVRCQLVPTLPSYETKSADGTVYHNPDVENLLYAAQGLNQAISEGANVYGAGIFWWSNFIGRNAGVYPSARYTPDQNNWMNLWVNHG